MKRFVFLLALLLCSCQAKEPTVTVPQLHGSALRLTEDECRTLTPLGWAMLLDRRGDKDEEELEWAWFHEACQKDKELMTKVADLAAIKNRLSIPTPRRRFL